MLIIFNNSNCGNLTEMLEKKTHIQAWLHSLRIHLAIFYSFANLLGKFEAIEIYRFFIIISLEDIFWVSEIL